MLYVYLMRRNIKVGLVGQSEEEVHANIMAVIRGLAKKIPGGYSNVASLHLKLPESVSLPLYSTTLEQEEAVVVSEE
jgi:ribosome biogenesis protein UTP30